MPKIAAILLAAGRSSRMKESKALLPWGSTKSLILYQIESLESAGFEPIVTVLGHNYEAIQEEISNCNVEITINAQYDQGRSSSIIAGLKALPSRSTDVLFISVDQPRTKGILTHLRQAWANSDALIATPSYGNNGGHPIIFKNCLIPELLSVTEAKNGLREIVTKYQNDRVFVPINDPLVLTNINNLEDYNLASKIFESTNL
tara:strand:- start:219 stop:827 length:609 start_codon:yes stop_codon:yes gene_type:complete